MTITKKITCKRCGKQILYRNTRKVKEYWIICWNCLKAIKIIGG